MWYSQDLVLQGLGLSACKASLKNTVSLAQSQRKRVQMFEGSGVISGFSQLFHLPPIPPASLSACVKADTRELCG